MTQPSLFIRVDTQLKITERSLISLQIKQINLVESGTATMWYYFFYNLEA